MTVHKDRGYPALCELLSWDGRNGRKEMGWKGKGYEK